MYNKRSKIAVVHAVLALVLILAACSGGSGNRGSEQPSGNSASAGNSGGSASEGSADGSEMEGEVHDYGEITLVNNASTEKPGNEKVAERIRELMGVKVNVVYGADRGETFNLMVTAGEDVDGVKVSSSVFANQLDRGAYLALDDYLETYGQNIIAKLGEGYLNWTRGSDGKIYGIPSVSEPRRYATQIRKDWLDTLNLDVPSTIDEFEQALIAFKENASVLSEGSQDLNPLFINQIHTDFALLGAFLPEGASWWKNDEGIYLPPEMHSGYKNYLATLQSWYNQGLILTESFVVPGGMFPNDFGKRNLIGATSGWHSSPYPHLVPETLERVPNIQYVVAQLSGEYDKGVPTITEPSGIFVVSANSKNPEGVIRYIDWHIATPQNYAVHWYGLPGVHIEELYVDDSYTLKPLSVEPEEEYGYALTFVDLAVGEIAVADDPLFDAYLEYGKNSASLNSYVPIDQELAISINALDAMQQYGTDLASAREEQFIRIVTGEADVDSWDNFLNTWRNMGMQALIDEKNEIYRSLGR